MIKLLINKIVNLFKRPKVASTEQTHWVNHICDEYVNASQKAVGMYANLHGFEEGSPGNYTYWVGVDLRAFGIRCADFVIRCKNKSTYDYWIDKASRNLDSIPQAVREDPNLNCKDGDDVNIQFIFRWGDEDKGFNVRFCTDRYAEEK